MHGRTQVRQLSVTLVLVAAAFATTLIVASPVVRADHDTVPWATIGQIVSSNTTLTNSYPNVLTDNSGHFYVFYDHATRFASVGNLRVSKFNSTNGLLGSPELWFNKQVNDVNDAVSSSGLLAATIDHTGNIYVAWTHRGVAPAYDDIYVSKSSDGGNTWLPAVRAGNPNDGTRDQIPTIAVAPNGDVYVAWTTYKPSSWFYNIAFSMSTNGGNTFINVRNISGQGAGGQAIIDSLALDSSGRAYIAYIGQDANGNVTPGYHINMTWSDNGLVWSAPSKLTPTNDLAIYPNLAIDRRDRLHLQWIDYRTLFSTGITMWYARSDDRGATWSPQRSIGDGMSRPTTLASLSVHGDTVMSVWAGGRTVGGVYEQGLGYATSADAGTSWYAEKFYSFRSSGGLLTNITWVHASPDRNGTFWAVAETYDSTATIGNAVNVLWWNGPPSSPTITGVIVSARGNATVTWSASPEGDVAAYSVWRSSDGTHYAYVASVAAGTTSHTDLALSNGTYWYEVTAIDTIGTSSHPSAPAVAQVGPSLQDQINKLQQDLNSANANIANLQTRLTNLQTALNNLQSTTQGNFTALQNQIKQLQTALNSAQAQQATQSTATLGLGLEVLIVVLLAAILMIQIRRPKNPAPIMMAPVAPAPPSQPVPRKPEDEL